MGSNPTLSVAWEEFCKGKALFIYGNGKFYIKEIDVENNMKMKQELIKKIYESPGIIKRKFRILIMIFILMILLAGTMFLYYHNPKEGLNLACMINFLTGYYCPGCGAGRACYMLLHGQIYQAFRYNPLLIILLPWLIVYYAACGIQWLHYGKERVSIHIPEQIPIVILVVFLIYGIVRNIEVYPFILLAPTGV